MTGSKGKYLLRTYGCQMNEHDSERIAGLLEADGYEPTTEVEDADVVMLNTCCIRENADNKLYGALGNLKAEKERRPDLQIAVGGCLAQKDKDLVASKAGHVDVVFGTHNVHRAAELLAESRERGQIVEILEAAVDAEHAAFPSALPEKREVDYSAWVTIQIGCDNSCAFCIVPSVRGPEISRSFGDLVTEVERLARDGVAEVTLLGQNVNSYGRDITLKLGGRDAESSDEHEAGAGWAHGGRRRGRPLFSDLLRASGAVEGIERVRYTSPHPKDLRDDTIAAMADTPEVCNHLHLPLQSGSDRILKAMHRGYTAERYLERLAAAQAGIDDLAVSTDIIVGFPGETDDDFDRTLEVAAEGGYDSAYTFVFSAREGTEAAVMVDDFVPQAVTKERMERLRHVIERSAAAKNAARVGRIEEVVIEGPSKRNPGVISGRTRQNKLVHFVADLKPGALATVEVTEAATHYLMGELRDVLRGPRTRTRIPVVAG
ncbi:MAG: MiaB/RimO family radical SAM methylthiotransferase [Acidimicrobiales bacterium]